MDPVKPSLSNPELDISVTTNKKKRLSSDSEMKEPAKKLTKTKTKTKLTKEAKSSPNLTESSTSEPIEAASKSFTQLEYVRLKGQDTESKLYEALKKYYNYDKFKSETQRRAVFEVSKRSSDVYVSMPTGAGKSLCFQLPALIQKGVAMVVSPLIALIYDQVEQLKGRSIPAESLNSKVPAKAKAQILKDLNSDDPKLKMLYITPELAAQDYFKQLLFNLNRKKLLSYFVVDEAHWQVTLINNIVNIK